MKHPVGADVAESDFSTGCFTSYSRLTEQNVEKVNVTKLFLKKVDRIETKIGVTY